MDPFYAVKNLSAEVWKYSKVSNTQSDICVVAFFHRTFSNFFSCTTDTERVMLSLRDKEMFDFLEKLENNFNGQTGYFCSDTVFNFSNNVLSEYKIKVLEKVLASIRKESNEPEVGKVLRFLTNLSTLYKR